MAVALMLDVHVPRAVADQPRRRGVDVLTAAEDGSAGMELAEDWQRAGRPFFGLVYGHQLGGSIGQFVRDLELIAGATGPGDWAGGIEHIPF